MAFFGRRKSTLSVLQRHFYRFSDGLCSHFAIASVVVAIMVFAKVVFFAIGLRILKSALNITLNLLKIKPVHHAVCVYFIYFFFERSLQNE
jgi:hypothetical protein